MRFSTDVFFTLQGLGWNEDLLDPLFSRVVDSLTIDAGCPTYLAVHNLKQRSTEGDWNEVIKHKR